MSDQEQQNNDNDSLPDLIEEEYPDYYEYIIQDEFMDEVVFSLMRREISNTYSNLATNFHVNLRNNLNTESENNLNRDSTEYNYESENSRFDDVVNTNLTNFISGVFNMVSSIPPFNLYDDVLERVMQESLETHNQLNRTEDFVEFTNIKYSTIVNKNYDSSCSICLVEFEDDSDIGITNCDHIFHKECITEWSRYKKDCPVCREELKNKIEKKD